MQITRVDPGGPDFAEWYAVLDTAEQEAVGADGPRPSALEWRADLAEDPTVRATALLGRVDGQVVGAGWISLPLQDNPHFAELGVAVLPAFRRQHLGAALLLAVEELARSGGRRTFTTPIARHRRPVDPARTAFAERHGYRLVLDEVRRELVLPVPAGRLDALERDCRPYATGYRVRRWQDRCPDDLVDGLARLEGRMLADSPLGGLDVQAEEWDRERVRTSEHLMRSSGHRGLWAGAMSQRGELVAFTDLRIPVADPDRAEQYGTLVLPEHRGHRLGLLVKIANLRQLAAESPATRLVLTENGETNAPMIAVNVALGFAEVGGLQTWQKSRFA